MERKISLVDDVLDCMMTILFVAGVFQLFFKIRSHAKNAKKSAVKRLLKVVAWLTGVFVILLYALMLLLWGFAGFASLAFQNKYSASCIIPKIFLLLQADYKKNKR